MAIDPDKHHRRSIRLKGYDYAQAGIYFVMNCIQAGIKALGEVDEGEMVLNDSGRIVEEEWLRTAELRPDMRLDAHVVMPNHFHGIVQILDDGETLVGQATLAGNAPTATGSLTGRLVLAAGQLACAAG